MRDSAAASFGGTGAGQFIQAGAGKRAEVNEVDRMRERIELFCMCCRGLASLWKPLLVIVLAGYLFGTLWMQYQIVFRVQDKATLQDIDIAQIRGEILPKAQAYDMILDEINKGNKKRER